MWKIVLAFIVFAAVALFMISKGGEVDMGGEKHGADATAPAGQAEPATPSASAASGG